MKTARSNNTRQNKQAATSKRPKPQNKDDMDSRKSKVADKDRTAKADKNEKVKTKNPVKKSLKKTVKKEGKVTKKDNRKNINN
jgi:hypothetical protein